MATPTRTLLGHLLQLTAQGAPDAMLLARWVEAKDESAFATLVARHGPMVLAVCRRVLGDWQYAEDAFQATFLILARKARKVRRPEALVSYLYAVALRLARKASVRRRGRTAPAGSEAGEPVDPCPKPLDVLSGRELLVMVDVEVARLPEVYRLPVLLCVLQERSVEEAARILGWTSGSVRSRLTRGRQRLRQRLMDRGLGSSGGALTLLAAGKVPRHLLAASLRNLTSAAPAAVNALAAGVNMALGIKVFCVALVLTAVGLGAGLPLLRAPEQSPPVLAAQAPPATITAAAKGADGRQKPEEVPAEKERLPEGAVARLGTARFANFGRPFGLSFTRDAKDLVVGSWDGILSVWDPAKKQLVKEWDSQAGSVRALAISPDGSTVAEAGRVSGIRLWRKADGQLLKTLVRPQGEKEIMDLLAFSPDGKLLVAAGYRGGRSDRFVRLWELSSGKPIYTFERPWSAGIHVPSFADDGTTLMLACYDKNKGAVTAKGYVLFVDVKTGKQTKRIPLPDESVPPWFPGGEHFALSSSGRWLVRVGMHRDGDAQDYRTGGWAMNVLTGRKNEILKNDLGFEYDVSFAVAPDEHCMAIVFPNQQLMVVELPTGQVRCRFQSSETGITSLAFSPDSRYLASGSVDRTVLLWDLTGRMAGGTMPPSRLSGEDLPRLWNELAAPDGATTRRAIWELVSGPKQSIPFLRQQLRPLQPVDARRIASLIHELGSESFQVRTKAARELEGFHDAAEPWMRQKLTEPVTLEVRRRLEQVLEKIEPWWLKNQGSRAVEVLEHIAGIEAQKLLKELTGSQASPRLADEAKAALRRLELREKS